MGYEVKVISMNGNSFNIQISENELIAINNALNEVCNGLDVRDFHTRIGATESETVALLKEIGKALDKQSRAL